MAFLQRKIVTVTIEPAATAQALDTAIAAAVATYATAAAAAALADGPSKAVAGSPIANTVQVVNYQYRLDSGDNATYTAQVQYEQWV